jgi:hypothetical protein
MVSKFLNNYPNVDISLGYIPLPYLKIKNDYNKFIENNTTENNTIGIDASLNILIKDFSSVIQTFGTQCIFLEINNINAIEFKYDISGSKIRNQINNYTIIIDDISYIQIPDLSFQLYIKEDLSSSIIIKYCSEDIFVLILDSNQDLKIPIIVENVNQVRNVNIYDISISNISNEIPTMSEITSINIDISDIDDISYTLILNQSSNSKDIIFETSQDIITGLKMYFDISFDLVDSFGELIYDISTNKIKNNYINTFNSDLSGWYIASNPNYQNNNLNSNMILIMFTDISNGIQSNPNLSNILFKIPERSDNVIPQLVTIDEIADSSGNDISYKKLLITNE